jgi:hypothetical protein
MAQGRAAVDADRTNFAPETVSPERNKDKLETKCSKSGYPIIFPLITVWLQVRTL